jgi:hypothetical protein
MLSQHTVMIQYDGSRRRNVDMSSLFSPFYAVAGLYRPTAVRFLVLLCICILPEVLRPE